MAQVQLLKALKLEARWLNMPYKDPKDPRKLAYNKAWYKANAEKVSEYGAIYRAGNKEKLAEKRKLEYAKNKEIEIERGKEWHAVNKESVAIRKKAYRANNKEIINSGAAKRRAAQKTPTWLSKFDKLKIRCVYSVAAMLTRENNEPWHVDHIIPLKGKSVCGLHVPNNLQFVRAENNLAKSNKYEVTA